MSAEARSALRRLDRVQVRITAVTMATVVIVLGCAAFALVTFFERELVRRLDAGLEAALDRVPELPADGETTTNTAPDDRVQVIDGRGRVRFASQPLRGEPALWTPGDPVDEPRTVHSQSLGDLRAMARHYDGLWLVLAEPMQPVEDSVRTLERAIVIGLPILALVLTAVIWTTIGRTLRPVAAAVEREEQLVADVSHELRSPLAGVRVLLETEPDDHDGLARNRREALATLNRLETITDQLLSVMREEQPHEARPHHPVDLDEIVLAQVRRRLPQAPVPIDTTGVVAGQVHGRPGDLESLVENLLSNALRHARSTIAITVVEDQGTVELAVDDDGPGIDPADRERVFERFTRLNEARNRDGGGAGLGLAIARTVAGAHRGSITAETSPLGGARFLVRLPASTAAASSSKDHRNPEARPTAR